MWPGSSSVAEKQQGGGKAAAWAGRQQDHGMVGIGEISIAADVKTEKKWH